MPRDSASENLESPIAEPESSDESTLLRVLQARHMTMLAIGGSIGAGLFLTSGKVISSAGPGGALIAYAIAGLMVYFLMESLGELAAKFPVAGGFSVYGSTFVEPGFGFALGWNYWFNWTVTIALDLIAASLIMQYWCPLVPRLVWCGLFFGVLLALNLISVRGFGEVEYWTSWIKVLTILAFIGLGGALIFYGWGFGEGLSQTFRYWVDHEAPFVGGLSGLMKALLIASFSFQGTELIGMAAGEAKNPSTSIPRAIKTILWRILVFYIASSFIIGTFIHYQDPLLLSEGFEHIAMSPFTLIFERFLGSYAAHIMNGVVLSAVLSTANSGLYAASRMLYGLAQQGMAPCIFTRLSLHGLPVLSIMVTTVAVLCCFGLGYINVGNTYDFLLNLSSMAGLVAWIGIAFSHYRFRRGWAAQGLSLKHLPYQAKFFPFGPIFAGTACILITLGLGIEEYLIHGVRFSEFLSIYGTLVGFLALWMGYRFYTKMGWIRYPEMKFPTEYTERG